MQVYIGLIPVPLPCVYTNPLRTILRILLQKVTKSMGFLCIYKSFHLSLAVAGLLADAWCVTGIYL